MAFFGSDWLSNDDIGPFSHWLEDDANYFDNDDCEGCCETCIHKYDCPHDYDPDFSEDGDCLSYERE